MVSDALPIPKRPRMERYAVGDRVDCTDLEGLWHEAVVKEVDPVQGYRVHFLGWSSRWDEWVEAETERIQPPYSKVQNWRPKLHEGDPIEVRSASYPDRWLSGVVVSVDPDEGRIKCEYSHDQRGGQRWVQVDGEEICLPNTHFSRQLDNNYPPKVEQFHHECDVHLRARTGDAAGLMRLIAEDPSALHLRGPLERTPLLVASDNCRIEVVSALMNAGAPTSDVDRSNANGLHLAVRGNRERCGAVVRALAEGGVEVNGRDSRLSTPLHLVAMRGYADVTLTLLRHGAHVNSQDMSGVTPLRHAAYRGEEAIVRLLLHYGADPTIPDAAGGLPIEVACLLRNKHKRAALEHLLREGHTGYLLRKMRQVAVWNAGYDVRELDCELLRRRRANNTDAPKLQWMQTSGEQPVGTQLASAVAREVVMELNRDLFIELSDMFV